jgi:3-phenylpropionate/trans-cinnamate dioxygenase ferredoxin reductase component
VAQASQISRVVILGGGQAGGETALRLRAGGFQGEITLIGDEPIAPYQRPPLSKAYLTGDLPADRLPLRPTEVYAAENIHLLLGRRANWIDRQSKRVRLEGGQEIPYDALVIATGARARRLTTPGADLPGVHVLRTAADVEAIKAELTPGAKLAVIGAGYIGLEAAASARKLGAQVTVLEAAVRPLARVTSPEVAGFFLDQHTAHGVEFRLAAQAAVFKGSDRVRAIGLADGGEVGADLVIVGIGVIAEVGLAEKAGLMIDNGIVTDRACRTADPAIYAIGDVARRPMTHYGGRMERLESVHSAIEGAKIAAAGILGAPPPAEETPWFWSDQYDLKLQIAGLFGGYDQLVLRGAMDAKSFAAFYLRAGQLIAVDAVNRPAEYAAGKIMIHRAARPDPARLADDGVAMKTFLQG